MEYFLVTTYQIRNVLRIYGNQLKKRTTEIQDRLKQTQQTSDFVDISIEARRKQMLNKISDDMISQVNPNVYQQNPEGKI